MSYNVIAYNTSDRLFGRTLNFWMVVYITKFIQLIDV